MERNGPGRCRARSWLFVASMITVAACAPVDDVPADVGAQVAFARDVTIDARRSLAVTELPILERFSFERVLSQLASQSGVPGLTPAAIFAQWWDTQNPGPGLGAGPHCDDEVDPELGSVINGYPYTCRPTPAEGAQASCDPFAEGSPCAYVPIGVFNRFDLAPVDGANCGEYRIIFAKSSGVTDRRDRNLVIFEAVLPNPHPGQGIKGCKKIADFWGDLSAIDDVEARADALEAFYFDGVANIEPVVDVTHYGDNPNGWGQVRSNQFVQPVVPEIPTRVWSLREFKLRRTCADGACTAMALVPVTAKINPFGRLFASTSTHASAADFQAFFPSQVESLAAADLSGIAMVVPEVFDSAQSESSGVDEGDFALQFGYDASPLRAAIADELTALGSELTPDDIVARAQTQTCAGCHRFSNDAELGGGLAWPPSLGFTHVSESETETVDGVARYLVSDALALAFLPHRAAVLEDYLEDKPKNIHNPHGTLGGSGTH